MVDMVSHRYNTRGARSNFFIDRSDSKSLKSIVPKTWNSLPSNMKVLTSIASFKEKSKGGLLAPYSLFVMFGAAAPVWCPRRPSSFWAMFWRCVMVVGFGIYLYGFCVYSWSRLKAMSFTTACSTSYHRHHCDIICIILIPFPFAH